MDYGMPVLIEFDSLEENIDLCCELGLDFIELNMNIPLFLPEALEAGVLRKYMERTGIYFTLHTADDINIADFNGAAADVHVNTVINAIKLAKEINAPVINMHLNDGTYMTLPDKRVYLYDKYNDLYMKRIKDFRSRCEAALENGAGGVSVCIENCGGFKSYATRALEHMLESELFGLTLDIGHDYKAGGVDMGFFMKNVNKLRHMHIHDGLGSNVHLTLGTGEIDLSKMFTLARDHNCRVVIETKTAKSLRESVFFIKNTKLR